MTWLKFINVFFFQLLFVRLTNCQEKRITDFKLLSFDIMPDGNIGSRGVGKTVTYQWYSLQFWILPLTGWGSDFIYLNKEPNFIKITKEKKIIIN